MVEFLTSVFTTLLFPHLSPCSSLAGKESNQWHHSDILLEGIFTTILLTVGWNPSNSHPIFCNLCHSNTTSPFFFRRWSIYLDTTVATSFSDQPLSRENFPRSLVMSNCFSRAAVEVFSSLYLDPCIWEQNLADRLLETKKLNLKFRFALWRQFFSCFLQRSMHAVRSRRACDKQKYFV